MNLQEAQAIVFDAVKRGEVQFAPSPYSIGAGHFITDDGRIPTNSTLVIALARRVQDDASLHEAYQRGYTQALRDALIHARQPHIGTVKWGKSTEDYLRDFADEHGIDLEP